MFSNELASFIDILNVKLNFNYEIEIFSDEATFFEKARLRSTNIYIVRIEKPIDFRRIKKLQKIDDSALINIISSNYELVFLSFRYHPYSFVRKNYFKEELPKMLLDIKKIEDKKNSILTITKDGENISVDMFKVIYAEVVKNDTYLFLDETSLKIRKTISQCEEMWKSLGFVRVHMSYIVNCAFVKSFNNKALTLVNGVEIPISRSRYQQFAKYYEEFSITRKI